LFCHSDLLPSFQSVKQQQHRKSASLKKSALKNLNCEEIVHAGKTIISKKHKTCTQSAIFDQGPNTTKTTMESKKIKETHIFDGYIVFSLKFLLEFFCYFEHQHWNF